MPLPRASEDAASAIARLLDDYDDALASFVATGGRPPSIGRLLDLIRPYVTVSVSAGLSDVDTAPERRDVAELVATQLTAIGAVLRAAERDARRARRKTTTTRRLQEQEDRETVAAFARRVGPYVALAALVAAQRPRARRRRVRDVARQVGARLPRPTAAHVKMIVRTETAIGRNLHAAKIADRDGKVIRVFDARKGPTDEACERVNGKYATPLWIRKHPVEHPNCTRLGRPVELPSGKHVTLLE